MKCNYIVSLGEVTRWLGAMAEALGVGSRKRRTAAVRFAFSIAVPAPQHPLKEEAVGQLQRGASSIVPAFMQGRVDDVLLDGGSAGLR